MSSVPSVFLLAVLVLAIYLLFRALLKGMSWAAGSKYRAYRSLAERYRGRYEYRGLSDPPTVSFPHNGSTVRVGLAPFVPGQPSPPRTRVVARFSQGLPFRFELFPFGRSVPPQPPKGTRLVRSGIGPFDREFIVHSNDPEIAAQYLQAKSVRLALVELRQLAPPTGMLVSINPERLLVQVDRNLGSSAAQLETAVRDALILHDHLKASVSARLSEGIEIVDSGPAPVRELGPPVCKVCGEPIVDPHVVCSRCGAPHHRDCWAFVGGCSIFGCQGKECVPS